MMKTVNKYLTVMVVFFFGLTLPENKSIAQNTTSEFANFEPTVYPDRIMLTIPGDPSTTRAVTWRTHIDVTKSVGQIALLDPSPEFELNADSVTGTCSEWEEGSQSAMGHKIVFENLQPNTRYSYRVGDGKNWSEWFQIETSSSEPDSFSFLYFGDVQNEIKSLGSRTLRQAYSHFPASDFMLFAGDLVSRSNEEYWREFFYAGGWIFGMVPSLVTPGNHEYYKPEGKPRIFSSHWKQIYQAPSNSPSEEYQVRNYFLDYQGVRLISFDSPAFGEYPQDSALVINWLKKTLSENRERWTILFTHYPIYSCSHGRNNPSYRSAVQHLLEKYNVDLVLTGHDHTYCRGFNAEGVQVKGKNMPLYVVSVAGPKMYGLNTSFWSDRMGSLTQLYQHISVSSENLEFKSFTVGGELYDAFVITKNEQGLNTFTESPEVSRIQQMTKIPENVSEKYSEEELKIYRHKINKQ